MKTALFVALMSASTFAFAQNAASNASAEEAGDKSAKAAETIMGINNPPTGIERARDAARNAGSKAGGGAADYHDNYKPKPTPKPQPKKDEPQGH